MGSWRSGVFLYVYKTGGRRDGGVDYGLRFTLTLGYYFLLVLLIQIIASRSFVAMKNSFYTAALAAMTASMGATMSVPRAGNYPIEKNPGFGNVAVGQVQKRGRSPYTPAIRINFD